MSWRAAVRKEIPVKRKGLVAAVYLMLALFVIGLGYALYTLFAPMFSTTASHSQLQPTRTAKKVGTSRNPPTHAVQTPTTSTPWGIALDAPRHIVWVAEPGCEPT